MFLCSTIFILTIHVYIIESLNPCDPNQTNQQSPCLPLIDQLDPNVSLIIALVKQGDLNPTVNFIPVPTIWRAEGIGQLSKIGKHQSYGYGQSLRQLIGANLKYNLHASSGSSTFDQQSLAFALAGFDEPLQSVGSINWSVAPSLSHYVSINDSLLNVNESNCRNFNAAWQQINDETLPILDELYSSKKRLLDYISANTGWPSSIATGELTAENVHIIQLNNATYPSWIEHPTLIGYTKQSMIDDIIDSFYEITKIVCSNYAPCRNVEGASLIAEFGSLFLSANKSTTTTNQLYLFVSKTEEVLSNIHLAFNRRDSLPDAGGVLYLFRQMPTPAIRTIFSQLINNNNIQHIFYQAEYEPQLAAICDSTGWCPLDPDAQLIISNTVSRQQACSGA